MPYGKTNEMIHFTWANKLRRVKPREKKDRDRTLNGKQRRQWRKYNRWVEKHGSE